VSFRGARGAIDRPFVRAGDDITLSAPCEPTALPSAKAASVVIVPKLPSPTPVVLSAKSVPEGLQAKVPPMNFAGPVAIAVTSSAVKPEQLSGLATTSCRNFQLSGLFACIDELFANDGAPCAPNPPIHPDFAAVTALPSQNNFRKMCTKNTPDKAPPLCGGHTTDPDSINYTLDVSGNVLLNMDWHDIIHGIARNPNSPRQLQGSVDATPPNIGAGVSIPSERFLESFNKFGVTFAPPPTFRPGALPGVTPSPGTVTLWGTADKDESVLRIDRRKLWNLACGTDPKQQQACEQPSDCPAGISCASTSVGYFACDDKGGRVGLPCTRKQDCAGGTCSRPYCYNLSNGQKTSTRCVTDADCSSGEECGLGLFNLSSKLNQSGIGTIPRDKYDGIAGPYK
jgi:hypothetical protein